MAEKIFDRRPNFEKSGCDTLKELWKVAHECAIDDPGYEGTIDRFKGLIQCKNVNKFMSMATMKCWEERNSTDFPPIVQIERINSTRILQDPKQTPKRK